MCKSCLWYLAKKPASKKGSEIDVTEKNETLLGRPEKDGGKNRCPAGSAGQSTPTSKNT
jgi:hypothetical protein